MTEVVRSRHFGRVAVVELHRPEVRHAMNTDLLQALIGALRGLAQATDTDAVVVTGSDRCFSSGADVSEDIDRAAALERMDLFGTLYELVATYPLPTVAAIGGWCIGGGAEVASACDLRVGTPSTSIRFPGAAYGVPAGAARLPLLIGLSHAKDLLMTARTVGAEEAYRMGFLNRLVAEEQLLDESAALALVMASNPGAITQKRALDEATGLSARLQAENRGLRRWQSEAKGLMG
ncbi:MAG: enoyl-CoA hydratase/isomerase family protein [Actinobacteria bacterium]|nr:enoyl-CoA hydratase/isomerase family protein [Actinomycetota bacterium]